MIYYGIKYVCVDVYTICVPRVSEARPLIAIAGLCFGFVTSDPRCEYVAYLIDSCAIESCFVLHQRHFECASHDINSLGPLEGFVGGRSCCCYELVPEIV